MAIVSVVVIVVVTAREGLSFLIMWQEADSPHGRFSIFPSLVSHIAARSRGCSGGV